MYKKGEIEGVKKLQVFNKNPTYSLAAQHNSSPHLVNALN